MHDNLRSNILLIILKETWAASRHATLFVVAHRVTVVSLSDLDDYFAAIIEAWLMAVGARVEKAADMDIRMGSAAHIVLFETGCWVCWVADMWLVCLRAYMHLVQEMNKHDCDCFVLEQVLDEEGDPDHTETMQAIK